MNQDKNQTEQGPKRSYQTLWRRLLPRYDEAEAKAIVRLVLDEGFGLTMADICCGKVEELPAAEQERLQNIMTRLGQGEPVQYVLGRADFCVRRPKRCAARLFRTTTAPTAPCNRPSHCRCSTWARVAAALP